MKRLFLIAALALLAGCGPSETPMSRFLSAMRAGDHAAVAAAKTDADADTKTAIQPDGDLCLMNMADVEKYGVVYAMGKLDQEEVFRMSEEARYVFALTWAGRSMSVPPGSFLMQAPLYKSASTGHSDTLCVGKQSPMQAMAAGGSYYPDAEEARMAVMQDWMYDMMKKHGAQYDDRMRDAASALRNAGYHATWPPDFDFMEKQERP
jgi:hypothetical protein